MDKVVYTDEFENWFDSLEEPDQDRVAVSVNLLAQMGVSLPFPHSSAIVDQAEKIWKQYVAEQGWTNQETKE